MSVQQSAGPPAGHPESGVAPDLTPARSGCWAVVPAASTARFRARDLTRRTVVGTFPIIEGYVEVDGAGCPLATSALLDATGIETGIGRRDRDLRSRRFFDVAAFPTIAFTAAGSRATEGGWVVEGRLLVRGVPCPVVLDVRREPAGEASDGLVAASSSAAVDAGPAVGDGTGVRGETMVVVATTTLDRRDAGLRAAPGFVVGHRVEIEVRATLRPPPA